MFLKISDLFFHFDIKILVYNIKVICFFTCFHHTWKLALVNNILSSLVTKRFRNQIELKKKNKQPAQSKLNLGSALPLGKTEIRNFFNVLLRNKSPIVYNRMYLERGFCKLNTDSWPNLVSFCSQGDRKTINLE